MFEYLFAYGVCVCVVIVCPIVLSMVCKEAVIDCVRICASRHVSGFMFYVYKCEFHC